MIDKELIRKLLLENSTFNNVEITKLYNQQKVENRNPESFRKVVKKIRDKMKMGNSASKYTSKKFYDTGFVKSQTDDDVNNDRYRHSKVNNDKGTLESEIIVSFEPRNDEELAKLHRVDLTKYRISNYWTKLLPDGKFTSSLLCTLRKLGDSISLDEVKNIIEETVKDIKPLEKVVVKKRKELLAEPKALIFWIADEHVGASVSGSIYDNTYDANEYYRRKLEVIRIAKEEVEKNGLFDKIIFCTLGDNLDGFNKSTTRSLTGGSTHTLEQNMTNSEAIKTYVDVNKLILDELVASNLCNSFEIYNVNNSNHGGLGFDYMGNYALRQYLEAKYDDLFKITDFDKIIDKFEYGKINFFLAHGKDEIHMKRNMPIVLNPNIENYLKEYIDEYGGSKLPESNVFVKGDLHQFATQQGRWFSYQNCPSLFGSSAWVHANFGKGKAGFCYSVVNKKDTSVNFTPVWVK